MEALPVHCAYVRLADKRACMNGEHACTSVQACMHARSVIASGRS